MDLNFLRPRTPEPSFDDLLSTFSSDQIGDGVVTRRQARLAESQGQAPESSDQVSQSSDEVSESSDQVPESSDQGPTQDSVANSPEATEATNLDAPYVKDTLIASNNDVEAYCIKTHFRKMKNFASEDSLFKVHLKSITKKVILWSSLEDILTKVLTIILTNIQHHHRKDENALLYFCIAQTPLVSGIRSSVHVLAQNSVPFIVANFLSDFHRFVISNAEMKLNDTFELSLHVASALNVSRPTNRRKAIPIRSMVGSPNFLGSGSSRLKGSLINLPEGYPNSPECFKDSCALSALTYKMLEVRNAEQFAEIKPLIMVNSKKHKKNKAGSCLFEEMQKCALAINIEVKGPHDLADLIQRFAVKYALQIIVILTMLGNQVQTLCAPTAIDFSRPRIYLYLKKLANGIDHILIINSLATFFGTFQRGICFFCKKFYSTGFQLNKRARHKCDSKKTCSQCFGFFLQPDTLKFSNEPWQYCDSQINPINIHKCCNKCGFYFATEMCFSSHNLYCQTKQYFWSCPVCQKSVSMAGKSIQVIEETHKCSEDLKFCPVCYKMLPLHHVCPISKTDCDRVWPNIGVISLTYLNGISGLCQICFENRVNYMKEHKMSYAQLLGSKLYSELSCINHLNKQINVANVIKMYFEVRRFEFAARTFSTANFLANEEQIDEINFAYCDSPLPFSFQDTRKRKLAQDKADLFQIAAVSNPITASEQFLNYLLSAKLSNYVFLIQSNFEMLTLLELFVTHFYQPSTVQNGRNVKKLCIHELNLTFLLFENYCEGNLLALLRQFNISQSVSYFPWSFNDSSYYSKIIETPEFPWFLSFFDDSNEKQDKLKFFSQLPKSFNVNHQLYNCVSKNLKSFLLVILHFLRQCFDLEDLLCSLTQKHLSNPPIHPFKNAMSLSGFSMSLCKFFYLNRHHICSISKPYTGYSSKVSSKEYEYASFLSYSRPHENIKHAFNSTFGQKTFGNYPVDAYGENSLTVYQYNSCELHGHTVPICTNRSVIAKKTTELSKNCYGTLVSELHQKAKKDKDLLFSKFGHLVKNYDIMWECEFQKFKNDYKDLFEKFWEKSGLDPLRPLSRLVPRASVRGGLLEVYCLSFKADDQYDLHYYDMNAQYSFIALSAQLPLGEYKIYLEHELKTNLTIENNQFFFNGESCIADIAHVTFVVPSNLDKPFLPIRIGDNCFYANCYTCLTKANCGPCRHRLDHKRKFSSTYTVIELQKALELNYKIFVHELWHFSQSSNVLQEFVSLMASYRLKNSADMPEDKILEYCATVNEKMHFEKPELALTPLSVQSNPAQKQFFKSILNSLFGRFALHSNYSKRVFVRSQHELDALAANKSNTILDFFPVSDTCLQVEYVTNSSIHSAKDANLIYTSIINASGRILMYDVMQKLTLANCVPLYCDTDGIIFSSPKRFSNFPFEIGPSFGQFKPVYKNATIKKFFSLGPRNYALVYEEDGQVKYVTKIKGICASSDNCQNIITPQVYEDFIEHHFQDEVNSIYIPQMRKKVSKDLNSFQYQMLTQKFTNELHIKRFILKKSVFSERSYLTYPYGYDFKNVSLRK